MPAKKTRREPDMQADLAAHMKAFQEAFAWTEKAMELRGAGKVKAAQAAERNAKKALRRVMEIEKRYPPITRERHMTKPRE